MLTDDDLQAIEKMIAALLDARGVTELPSKGALRTQRYRERKAQASQNVTPKRHKTSQANVTKASQDKGQSVTKPSQANVTPTAETWKAYAAAYQKRWGVEPMRNMKVNGQLAQFVTRIPAAEAPLVAAFFVQSNRGLYVSAKHPVDLLLRNAESLRTEWATGRSGTDTEARQADRTAATGNVFGKLIQEAKDASH